jgi:hypothetical protein
MDRYVETLTGESDGQTIRREFGAVPDAIAWLQGDGLTKFDDQPARGEVRSSDGGLIWAKSHLQIRERAEWDARLPIHRILARLGRRHQHAAQLPRWRSFGRCDLHFRRLWSPRSPTGTGKTESSARWPDGGSPDVR